MAHEYLNPVMDDAAILGGTGSTYHTLSGQAQQMLMVTTTTTIPFYYTFDSTADFTAAAGLNYQHGLDPIIIPVNHPTYINVYSSASGWLHITEFV